MAGHRQGETVNVSFSLLLVSLRGIAFQAVGDIVKVGFEIAIVCQTALQLVLVVLLESKIVLPVSIQKISVYLVAHHFVRDDKLGRTLVFSIYRYQTEIEEQTQDKRGESPIFPLKKGGCSLCCLDALLL